MPSRIVPALIAATVCLSPAAQAQETLPGDVTFVVPLNLTQLSQYIERVAVACRFGDFSDERTLSSNQEIPVTAGQVAGDVFITIAVDPYAPLFRQGQTLNYECTLSALVTRSGTGEGPQLTGWVRLDDRLEPSVAVSPTPTPITGTFVW